MGRGVDRLGVRVRKRQVIDIGSVRVTGGLPDRKVVGSGVWLDGKGRRSVRLGI